MWTSDAASHVERGRLSLRLRSVMKITDRPNITQ